MTPNSPSNDFRLAPCDGDGRPAPPTPVLPQSIKDACAATAELYKRVGYEPPWVGYVAIVDEIAVGGGAFTSPPQDGRVEIAYFTLPEHQGRGFATRIAQALVAIAQTASPNIEVFAKTEPEHNASTAILTRLGFSRIGEVIDHEIGTAWAWALGVGRRTASQEAGGGG